MSSRFLLLFLPLLLMIGLGTSLVPAAEPALTKKAAAEKAAAEKIGRLIDDLGSDEFDTRQKAALELEAVGQASVPALRKALLSDDPEVRRLALGVAEKLARKKEAAEVLEPKRFRLAFRDTPLHVAVAEFMRVSGVHINLEGVKSTERKITLDTGYTTFWDAYDKFCAAAGLVEKLQETTANDNDNMSSYRYRRRIMWARGGMITNADPDEVLPALKNGQFSLTEGKAEVLPAFRSGALRIRALPPGMKLGRASTLKGDKEVIFGLEIIPEPSLAWEKVQTLRVEKAVDDQGQALTATQAYVGDGGAGNDYDEMMLGGMGWDGGLSATAASNSGQRVPIRLGTGRKPSASLKELSGVVTIKMKTKTQEIAAVDNVLKAAGKTVKGKDGSILKVIEVKREDDGQVTLRLQVEQAPQEGAFNPWGGRIFWGGMPQNGGDAENVDGTVGTGHLALFDTRGHLVRLVRKDDVSDGTGTAEEWRFTFKLAAGQPDPARLVLQGRSPVTIDVPFTLKDVPLRAAPAPVKKAEAAPKEGGKGQLPQSGPAQAANAPAK